MDPHIVDRKRQQMDLAASDEAQSARSPGWEDVHLVPLSVPEVSLDDVDLTTEFLGHRLAAPLVISSMTGGHDGAAEINATLGRAAERLGVAIGVGSQRAALRDPSLVDTYRTVREHAPTAFVMANLGVCQLVPQGSEPAFTAAEVQAAVDMIGAQALAVHLNVVEELIQTEGDRNTSGLADGIGRVVAESPVPVVAKETGAGLTRESADVLADAGVAALDVGGAGGTSFARVEGLRAQEFGDLRGTRLGETFADWGVSTAASVIEVRSAGLPVVATGGVRSGLDAAKALALGAHLVGIGRPALMAARSGLDALVEVLELMLEELRVAMVLTGARRPAGLRNPAPVVTGHTGAWVSQRGLAP